MRVPRFIGPLLIVLGVIVMGVGGYLATPRQELNPGPRIEPAGRGSQPSVTAGQGEVETVTATVTQTVPALTASRTSTQRTLRSDGKAGKIERAPVDGAGSGAGPGVVIYRCDSGDSSSEPPLVVQMVTTISGSLVAFVGVLTTFVWVKQGKPESRQPPTLENATAPSGQGTPPTPAP